MTARANRPILDEGNYSFRKARIGSTEAAARAGNHDAAIDTIARTATDSEKMSGLIALTSNSRAPINRAQASVPASPKRMPISVSRALMPIIIRRTSPRRAPSAMRTPISRVRCATAYAITP